MEDGWTRGGGYWDLFGWRYRGHKVVHRFRHHWPKFHPSSATNIWWLFFFPRKLQHLISPTPPSLLPKWLWVRVWLKSDDDLRRQRSPSTLFGLLRPLSYMRPPKFTYVEYLSFPKVLDGTSGCADRLQTSVNDQPVRQNLYYLISRSCCTWSKWCKCVGVLISTAAVLLHSKYSFFFTPTHSFPLHITVVILTAWNNSAGLVDVFRCWNLFLFMLSTAS